MANSSPKSFDDPFPTITGVDRSETLYRIVDFFSAAQVIEDGALYVPLASTFDDSNEAIDAALQHLAISTGPCAGVTRHFSNIDEFIQHQSLVAQRNYVSCWTRTKESVAMWALYSKDHSSVQLSTTVANLEQATSELAATQSDPRNAISTGTGVGQFLFQSKIAAVKYDNLEAVARGIDRRRRAYDKLEAAGKLLSPAQRFGSATMAENRRAKQYRFETLEHKDSSFAHESEVRQILTFIPYDHDSLTIASRDLAEMASRPSTNANHPDYETDMLSYARAILREEAWTRRLSCKPSISLPLSSGCITSVTVDPRCPPHKLRFIRRYFESLGIPIAESSCFGHVARKFDVTPRRKLLKQN